ncbi:MAG: hypothetical protein ACRC7O_01440 [Fimbriiglobus sp.]
MSGRPSRRSLFSALAVVLAAPLIACAQEPGTRGLDAPPALPATQYTLDTDRIIFSDVEYDAPVRGEDKNRGEFMAYNEVVLHARNFPDYELRKAARKAITFRDLLSKAGRDFQFDLLFFDGRLAQLRDVKPTKPLAAAGVTALYEGWVFPTNGADPMCVLLTELPAGLEPSAAYSPAKPVSFAGYYFKLIQYESANPDPKLRIRRAPLIIAKTLTLGAVPPADEDIDGSWWYGFLPGMVGMFALIGSVVVGMTWFFGRGDKAHKRAIADLREKNNPFGRAE